jgi:hypothetical protein
LQNVKGSGLKGRRKVWQNQGTSELCCGFHQLLREGSIGMYENLETFPMYLRYLEQALWLTRIWMDADGDCWLLIHNPFMNASRMYQIDVGLPKLYIYPTFIPTLETQPPNHLSKMCTQTFIIFTSCPCRMTRVATCEYIRHKEEHEWHHLEPAPDYRTCPDLKTKDEVDGGCCEMGPAGTCLWVGSRTTYRVREPGDGKGRWDGDDFELPRGWNG